MKQETVLYDVKDQVCVITLNRPESLNAVNRALKAELKEALDYLDADDDARVAILTGAGRAFSADATSRSAPRTMPRESRQSPPTACHPTASTAFRRR